MHRFASHGVAAICFLVLLIVSAFTSVDEASARTRQTPTPTPTGAAAPAASGAWTLIDNHQNPCYHFANGGPYTNYYPVWISGSWTQPISVGASGLPGGSTSWTYDSPIAPGSSDGVGSLAYVAVQLLPSTPVGQYSAVLWASDGSTTENVPIGLSVRASCSRY